MNDPKIEVTELEVEATSGLQRRRFLRNAGLAGMAAAWSAPMIQTVAYATGTHPPPGSPFTPGECPRDDGHTTTGDTHSDHSGHSNHSKDKKNSGDTDSRRSRSTKDSSNPWDWSEDKTDSKDDWGW